MQDERTRWARDLRTYKRDPRVEALWFSVTEETHNDLGEPFPDPHAAVRHHGEVIAYYGGHNGTMDSAFQAARASIPGRVAALCGILPEDDDYPTGLFKGPEDY